VVVFEVRHGVLVLVLVQELFWGGVTEFPCLIE
jgi:hypothetical protein